MSEGIVVVVFFFLIILVIIVIVRIERNRLVNVEKASVVEFTHLANTPLGSDVQSCA
jgi:hypothetical protein